jgi:hypothetical protein
VRQSDALRACSRALLVGFKPRASLRLDLVVWLARLAGFEPATRCLEGTTVWSPDGAGCGPMGGLAALVVADYGAASASVCGQWLPNWLPADSLASLMFEQSNSVSIREPCTTLVRGSLAPGPMSAPDINHVRPRQEGGNGYFRRPASSPRNYAVPTPRERGGHGHCVVMGGKRCQRIVTGTGCEAIPLATTTRVLGPAGVVLGTVNLVDEKAPGAIETDVQLLVRA